MPRLTVRLADLTIGIDCLYEQTEHLLSDYRHSPADADFSVAVTPTDLENERQKCLLQYSREKKPCPNFTPAELESTALYRKIALVLPLYDAFVFHGSAVAVGNRAFIFTAKSGTGKTTHTNLWLKNIPDSFVVNGDKPILRLKNGIPTVYGTPWMGKENLGQNLSVPLNAICVLSRGEINTIEKTTFSAEMMTLIGQTYRPPQPDRLVATLKTLEKIGNQVSLYRLSCNMENEAAWVSYRGMVL